MFPLKRKNNVLPIHVINYIIFQMIGVTFLCVMLVLNLFDYEFEWLRISLLTFTIVAIIVYEIIINVWFYRRISRIEGIEEQSIETKDEPLEELKIKPTEEKKGYQEKYLWFLLMLLIDIFIIIYLLSNYVALHPVASLAVGIIIFYFISVFVRPYFGVNGDYKKESKKQNRHKR